jgi:hypothetical protein
MVVRAHRHAGRVLRRGDGVDDCRTTQEEWTMIDRELLELAAKAAGRKILQDPHGRFRDCTGAHHSAMNIFSFPLWNPLTDDGDTLRLFLALPWMCLETSDVGVTARERGEKCERVYFKCTEWLDDHNGDPQAATRRAVTRAAAEIGKGMP